MADKNSQSLICIECTHPVSSLYTEYSSTNIRLTVCPQCNNFADKYVEHDNVLILIDLVLLKPQVYRHLVFNHLNIFNSNSNLNPRFNSELKTNSNSLFSLFLHPTACRMFILFTLFDVYLTWVRMEKQVPDIAKFSSESNTSLNTNLSTFKSTYSSSIPITSQSSSAAAIAATSVAKYLLSLPGIIQYVTLVILCFLNSITCHIVLRILAKWWCNWDRPAAISTTLLISYAPKLFPIIVVIWYYDIPVATSSADILVSLNLVEALGIVLQCGRLKAIGMVAVSSLAQGLVNKIFFRLLTLGEHVNTPLFSNFMGFRDFFQTLYL